MAYGWGLGLRSVSLDGDLGLPEEGKGVDDTEGESFGTMVLGSVIVNDLNEGEVFKEGYVVPRCLTG